MADPVRLAHLAKSLQIHFERTGSLSELNQAIECQKQALSLSAGDALLLNGLGVLLSHRFVRSGDLIDINTAIENHESALCLVPDDHARRAVIMNELGLSLRRRYGRLGNPDDINRAVEYQKRSASTMDAKDPDLPGALNKLNNSLGLRFERLGKPEDIEQAIENQTRCVELSSETHPEYPKFLNNLGNSFWRRFEYQGKMDDLDRSIQYRQEAVSLAPKDHPERHRFLNNLGVALMGRFERLGDLTDLDEAIKFQKEVLTFRPAGHPDRSTPLNNLGICYRMRFERLASPYDADRSAEYHQEALSNMPDGHARRPVYLVNLGQTLLARHWVLVDRVDMERALDCLQKAISLMPSSHADRSRALLNLGEGYRYRFLFLQDKRDIDEAVNCQRQSLSLAPVGYSSKSYSLEALGVSLVTRFNHFEDPADLDGAIDHYKSALALTSANSANLPHLLYNLARVLQSRYTLSNDTTDLDKGIENQQKAISLLPEYHSSLSTFLAAAGHDFETRFSRLGQHEDLSRAFEYFQRAAEAKDSPASPRFNAVRRWIRFLAQYSDAPTLPVYRLGMRLIQDIVGQGATVKKRCVYITHIGDFVTEAAAAAISAGKHTLALEWLEQGRSIVWTQRLQLRQPVNPMYTVNPSLARLYKQVMSELEVTASADQMIFSPDRAMSLDEAARKHRRLAGEWASLTEYARAQHGFKDFLMPKKVNQLAGAAWAGPVVLVNIHETRCDALALLTNGDTLHIQLPSYSHLKAKRAYTSWTASLSNFGVRNRGMTNKQPSAKRNSREPFAQILTELWTDVVQPVLESLGFLRIHAGKLPRITWCTTGPLAFLPVHAAGTYGPGQPRQRIFDYVISSYAPTITSLLPISKPSDDFHGLLAIGQEATPGQSHLPFSPKEIERIQTATIGIPFQKLTGSDATVNAALNAIQNHSWVHMACHATQDATDPGNSAFFLQDGKLSLAEITKRPLKHAKLAFLSACQTASGDETLPEEAIHLAAGMMMAGFGTVIATMWSMKDMHGPMVAEKVYSELVRDGKPDVGRAAEALHDAVAHLRETIGEDKFEEWAPFILVGSTNPSVSQQDEWPLSGLSTLPALTFN